MCLVQLAASTWAHDIKCFDVPPRELVHDTSDVSAACFMYSPLNRNNSVVGLHPPLSALHNNTAVTRQISILRRFLRPLQSAPFLFDRALTYPDDAIVAGELYSVSTLMSITSATFANAHLSFAPAERGVVSCVSFVPHPPPASPPLFRIKY
jgi:hypothetical protein